MFPSSAVPRPRTAGDKAVSANEPITVFKLFHLLGLHQDTSQKWIESIPFAAGDVTLGVENELQAAVKGLNSQVDLPLEIKSSRYFDHLIKQAKTGESSEAKLNALTSYLNDHNSQIWENSWVRFPYGVLNDHAKAVFDDDLLADKSCRQGCLRSDKETFFFDQKGQHFVRVPVSYLLKLALADALGDPQTPQIAVFRGSQMMNHFLNDNTSPETYSFYTSHNGTHNRTSQEMTSKNDMAHAAELQALITALAYKYILSNKFTHQCIPNTPFIESERRQIFFGTAIGIPTFYVFHKTQNRFLLNIVKTTKHTRASKRYPGYIRVLNHEYQKSLVKLLKDDAADLIELMGCQHVIQDLETRLSPNKNHCVSRKMTQAILNVSGAKTPMKVSGAEFNTAAEQYYRETLRHEHNLEAYGVFVECIKELDSWISWREGYYNRPFCSNWSHPPVFPGCLDFCITI